VTFNGNGNLTGSAQYFNDKVFYNGVATQSLRFDDGSSHKLTKDFSGSSPDNDKKMTISVWVKRGNLSGSTQVIIGNYNSVRFLGELAWDGTDKLRFDPGGDGNGSSNSYRVETTALFRDVSAWYHIVLAYDSTQGTDTNRVKLYVNGTQQTLTAPSGQSFPPLNYAHLYSYAGANNTIGEFGAGFNSGFLDGYLSEFNFIDGLSFFSDTSGTPNTSFNINSFGETKNGVWIAKEYEGSYGTNGYRLEFKQTGTGTASTSTIGADTSGNNNHWTSSGIVASDCNMPDSPENNFPTLNPLVVTASATNSYAEGNLQGGTSSTGGGNITATMAIPSEGKWYWEFKSTTIGSGINLGLWEPDANEDFFYQVTPSIAYLSNANKRINNSTTSYGASWDSSNIIGVAVDIDGGTVTFYKDNASQGAITFDGSGLLPVFGDNTGGSGCTAKINFGQDPSFSGTLTGDDIGTETPSNGVGVFKYAPPTGYLALCSANLPEPTIGPNVATQADDYFNTVLWTGNGTNPRTISGVGFQPDWIWHKPRNLGYNHLAWDSSRGAGSNSLLTLFPNLTNDESDSLQSQGNATSFDSDGFIVNAGSSGDNHVNDASYNYVAWNWKANGGTTSSNTDGSITSTVQANTTAGFSIVTYTGNGTNGATIGHGLGVKPAMISFKNRDSTAGWATYHKELGATKLIYLDLTNASTSSDAHLNNTEPTDTLITLHDHVLTNSSDDYVAYCFAEIEGYSRFGSFLGNGDADGAFVHTGFRPAWLMVKRYDSTNNWHIWDTTRGTSNPMGSGSLLVADDVYYESQLGSVLDILSNGFKPRANSNGYNGSGASYIYMAFAETPFKYANAR